MLKSAVTEEKKFKYSPWVGADNPIGPIFWCQQEGLITLVICCKFKKNLFNLWLYTHVHDLVVGDKILMSTETSCHLIDHLLQFSQTSLWSLILYIFLSWFCVYSPGAGADNPWGRNFDANRNILSLRSLVTSFFEVWFYTFFFHDFALVYSPGAGADNPLGMKFWCQQERPISSFICYKIQKNLWFYTFVMILYICHDFIHVYSSGAEAVSPQGTKFWCQQKSCCFIHLLQVSNKCLWSLILYIFFFHDLIHVHSSGQRDKIFMSTERSYHFIHLLQVSKKSLWSLFLYNFFMI